MLVVVVVVVALCSEEILEKLRKLSRRKYLDDREAKKLQALEDTIKDEEYLFQGMQLTASEQRVHDMQRELLRFVRDRMAISSQRRAAGYYIPEGEVDDEGKIDRKKREDVLNARYIDVDETPHTDQDIWADHQVCDASHNMARTTTDARRNGFAMH
jgi:pre-mRNA-splicing factor ATP-dependent RNA helicase DHX16